MWNAEVKECGMSEWRNVEWGGKRMWNEEVKECGTREWRNVE